MLTRVFHLNWQGEQLVVVVEQGEECREVEVVVDNILAQVGDTVVHFTIYIVRMILVKFFFF